MYEWQDGPRFCTLMDREKDQPVAQVTKAQDRFFAWGLIGSLKLAGSSSTLEKAKEMALEKAKEMAAASVDVVVGAALALALCVGLRAADPPKPVVPAITDAQRAAYWQALAELNSAQAVFQQRITEMRETCAAGGQQLGQGTDRQPTCIPAPKPEVKK